MSSPPPVFLVLSWVKVSALCFPCKQNVFTNLEDIFSAKTTWDFNGRRSQGPNNYTFNYIHEVAMAKINHSAASWDLCTVYLDQNAGTPVEGLPLTLISFGSSLRLVRWNLFLWYPLWSYLISSAPAHFPLVSCGSLRSSRRFEDNAHLQMHRASFQPGVPLLRGKKEMKHSLSARRCRNEYF